MSARIILLLKADQLGLFEKLVPVKASVAKDGTVRGAHVAIRHVRAPVAKKPPHKSIEDHQADLFGAPAKPAPVKANKPPEPETGDLFAHAASKPEPVKADHHYEVVSVKGRRFAADGGHTKGSGFGVRDTRTGEFWTTSGAHPVDFKKRSAAEEAIKDGLLPGVKTVAEQPEPEPDAPAPSMPTAAPSGIDYDRPFADVVVPAFGVQAGTSKDARRKLNADAQFLVDNKSDFSPADRDLLRQYSGNGGCGDSLNEFYTDPHVAAAMWSVLRRMGVAGPGSTALEPSCATGVFMATAPAGVTVTGVEMDPTSSKIGAALNPAHEVQNASLERFAVQDDRLFDVVIGNAPFGLRGSLLKDDKRELKSAEGYFMDTALDKLRPGGVVAMIVPTGIMNGKNSRSLRERLLRKGEFAGAIRMPNTAFEAAHTDVTSDILFFRKRPLDVAGALGAVDQPTLQALGAWDEEYLAGSYFEERGADNVLGTVGTAMRSFGEIYTVNGSMVGVPEAIAGFQPEPAGQPINVADILASAKSDDDRARILGASMRRPYDRANRGDRKMVDGVEYILEGDPLRWHRVDEYMQSDAVIGAQAVAAEIERSMAGEDVPDLEAHVRAYVEKHGNPSKDPNLQLAAHSDKTLYRLIGAVKPDGSLSDAVTGRKAAAIESSFDAAAQGLALELGSFTPAQVAGRWHGGDTEAALDHLYASPDYALEPGGETWTSSDNYLSGELWPKLDAARAAAADEAVPPVDRAKYERQADQLEAAIDPKSLEDVDIALNSAFLPLKVIEGFFNARQADAGSYYADRPGLTITFDKGVYALSGGTYDTGLLEKYLNRTGIKKDKDLPTIERWNQEFKTWLCASEFRDEVEELYNRSFRGFRQKAYSDKPFEIPGLRTDGLKPHIYSGLRCALEAGKGILADDVGLGKTVQGLMLARMMKATGKAKKPLVIVPKSVAANWVAEAEKWFPGSNVLVIGETVSRDKNGIIKGKEDGPAERNRKFHDLSQNDYDFVFITQPAWNDLDLDPITKGQYVEDDFWVQRGDSLGSAGDKRTNKIRESYNQAVANREFSKRTDAIYFNDLGVDAIITDECFPADTPILTDNGWMAIGDIVEQKLKAKVLSFNKNSCELEWKPIVRWIPIRRMKDLVRVHHEYGYITCTEDHEIWTERGYVKASRLQEDDRVFLLRAGLHSDKPKAGSLRDVHESVSDMPSLQGYGCGQGEAPVDRPEVAATSILFDQVLGSMAGEPAGSRRGARSVVSAASWQISPRTSVSGVFGEDEGAQPNERSGRAEAGDGKDEGAHLSGSRRQRSTDQAADDVGGGAWVADGARHTDISRGPSLPIVTDLLQGRSGESRAYARDRGGWSDAQNQEMEIPGRSEDLRFERVRVARVEVLECGGSGGPGSGDRDHSTVYDLEVADNHNFIAAGVLVSNCHAYKNLYAAKNRFGQSPKFLGGQGLSNRALDMSLKARWIRERNGGDNVYGLTATPTKNSPLEIYSMLSHIAPEAFERIGVRNSEEFLDRFCEFETRNILNTTGHIEEATCVVGFKNLGELREIMRRYINRRTAADVGLQLPERDDQQHLVDMSAEQKTVYAKLREDATKAKGKDATGDAHIFSIMDKMGKAALDLELYDPSYAASESPVFKEAVGHIVEGLKTGGQVVFCDSINSHEKLATALAGAGVDRKRIGIFNAQAASSATKRQALAEAYKAGKLDVVIGNTATMGEGVDGLQVHTADMHHLDLPWDPASMQQRNGRSLRQGNTSGSVRIHTYLPRGSFYGYRYQTMLAKKDWQDLLWSGGDRVDNLALEGAMSREDMMVMLSENPEEARAELDKNKEAAQTRFAAQKAGEAAEHFISYRAMKQSYANLDEADRKKPSGERLRVKMERSRVALEENPHFKAKHALDSVGDVLISRATGNVFEPGVAFEVTEATGGLKPGAKYVVAKVHASHDLVQVREYGDAKVMASIEIDKLGHGIKPVSYDEKEEQAALSAKLAADTEGKQFSSMADLRDLPESVLTASFDQIQEKVKAGMKNYKFRHGYGSEGIGYVTHDGQAKLFHKYGTDEASRDHHVMLPTSEHRAAAIEAYIANEQAKEYGKEFVSSGGRRGGYGRGEYKDVFMYPKFGYGQPSKNEWRGVLEDVFGPGTAKEAHAEYQKRQLERVHAAPTFKQAMIDAGHLAGHEHAGMTPWPSKALGALWARARKDGILDDKMADHMPDVAAPYSSSKGMPRILAEAAAYPGGARSSVAHLTVREALSRYAKGAGHADMAAAMGNDDGDDVRAA